MMAWSGSGWWVAICNLLGGALAFGAAWLLHGADNVAGAIFFVLWGIISGAAISLVMRTIVHGEARTLVDAATGERIEIPRGGTFSFLPMGYWALINPIFGAAIAVVIYLGYWNPLAEL